MCTTPNLKKTRCLRHVSRAKTLLSNYMYILRKHFPQKGVRVFLGSQHSHQGIFAVLYGLTFDGSHSTRCKCCCWPRRMPDGRPRRLWEQPWRCQSWVVFGELGTGCIVKMMMSMLPKNGDMFVGCFFVVIWWSLLWWLFFFCGDWGVTLTWRFVVFFLKLKWFFYVHRLNLWSQLAELCPADAAFQQKDENDKTDVLNPHVRNGTSLRKRWNVWPWRLGSGSFLCVQTES